MTFGSEIESLPQRIPRRTSKITVAEFACAELLGARSLRRDRTPKITLRQVIKTRTAQQGGNLGREPIRGSPKVTLKVGGACRVPNQASVSNIVERIFFLNIYFDRHCGGIYL